jgi:delta8-fatty-acid desaturase
MQLNAAQCGPTNASQVVSGKKYAKDRNRVWNWSEIKEAVEYHGKILFVFENNVYDVSSW